MKHRSRQPAHGSLDRQTCSILATLLRLLEYAVRVIRPNTDNKVATGFVAKTRIAAAPLRTTLNMFKCFYTVGLASGRASGL